MNDDDEVPPAVAVSPADQSSDREQSDVNQALNIERNLDDRAVADAADQRAVSERESARVQAMTDQRITNDRIDRLIKASEKQSAANEQLALAAYAEAQSRIEMQERARLARRRFRVTVIAISLTTAAVLTGIFVLLAKVNMSLDSGKNVRDTLLDCVQPTGHCYRQGQTRTAQLVGTLNKVTTLAAACAPDYVNLPLPERVIAIEHCIRRGLK